MALSHRRTPVQRRSADMMDRILGAATRVLTSDGYAQMNTNRIADEAEVSVGSLYRYFANKEEIFEMLRARAADETVESLADAMVRTVGLPARQGVRAVLLALIESLRANAGVTAALINEVPMGSQSNVLPEIERGLSHFVRMYAAQQNSSESIDGLGERIYLAMGITLNSCLRIALEKPADLDAELLIDLTTDILVLGLSPAAGAVRTT